MVRKYEESVTLLKMSCNVIIKLNREIKNILNSHVRQERS